MPYLQSHWYPLFVADGLALSNQGLSHYRTRRRCRTRRFSCQLHHDCSSSVFALRSFSQVLVETLKFSFLAHTHDPNESIHITGWRPAVRNEQGSKVSDLHALVWGFQVHGERYEALDT